MKKIILFILISLSYASYGQITDYKNAIGLKFGGGQYSGVYGGGINLSYQRFFTENKNRLELNLGAGGNNNGSGVNFDINYQWRWSLVKGLLWYTGPAAGSGIGKFNDDTYFALGVGGLIGLEYDFNTLDVPLAVTLDFQPMVNFVSYNNQAFSWGFGLGLRYTL